MNTRDVERLLREAAARDEAALAQIDQDALIAQILARVGAGPTGEPGGERPPDGR